MVNLAYIGPRPLTDDEHTPLTRHLTLEERWERAFVRAHQMRRNTRYEGPGHYTLLSERFQFRYDLVLYGASWRCNCPTGQTLMPCKHLARLFLRLQREDKKWHLWDEPESEGEWFLEESIEEPPWIASGTIDVTLVYTGPLKPLPDEDEVTNKKDPFAQYKEAMG